jgi:hypothetical protein
MRSILIGVVLFLVTGFSLAIKNGCKPGTTGCGICFQYPGPPDPGCKTDSAGLSDFDGDYKNDLVYRNQALLSSQTWIRYGAQNATWKTFSPAGMGDSKWELVATGYFEHVLEMHEDLDSDLLWQHKNTRELKVWVMDKFQRSSVWTLPNPGPNWEAVATGFFGAQFGENDGLSDILFWNVGTGDLKIWIMDGQTLVREEMLNWKMPNLSWNVVATGLFGEGNFDPFSDILWYNPTTGEVRLWVMDGAILLGEVVVGTEPNLDWKAFGVVDFDRNGFPDILFRKIGAGNLRYWTMNGPNRTIGPFGTPTPPIVPSVPPPADLNWKPVPR